MKFDKSKFTYYSGYLMYGDQFVARFKHRGPVSKGVFLKQLLKNHTVDEYFHKHQVQGIAPLTILKDADPHWYNCRMESFKLKMNYGRGNSPVRSIVYL